MNIDFSIFNTINVIDTCAIWNILCSKILYSISLNKNFHFICTNFVIYECLHKPRSDPSSKDLELQQNFANELNKGNFKTQNISIQDLQDIEILEKRKKLSRGELSAISFAKKINQAFLSDDENALGFAKEILNLNQVQSTSHLVGHFIFHDLLLDSDVSKIILELSLYQRNMREKYEQAKASAYYYKMLSTKS